jgi:hypothetical protein
MFQFVPAPANELFWSIKAEEIAVADLVAGLSGSLPVNPNLASQDGSLSFFPALQDPTFHQRLV